MRRIPLILALIAPIAAPAAEARRIEVTGEVMDTWCYFSGVMGGQEAVLGTAHHTCALWCAAGGIPVGLRADDGTVYMVLKWEGSDDVAGGEMILDAQSDRVSVDGLLHERDGMRYLLVERVVANEGIVNLSHEDYDVTPPFAVPAPEDKR